jgi:hypothetical protein
MPSPRSPPLARGKKVEVEITVLPKLAGASP